jgi:superfamily II DNA or RNA helicase
MINEVMPNEWILPNRIGYNEKLYKSFKPDYYSSILQKPKCDCDENVCDLNEDAINLYPQQRFIRDYIQFNSPYRGALLYHELGSGKSGASIAAAEGYIEKKKIFVLSPASIAVNYENEILKISSIGLNLKKDWTQIKISKTTNKKGIDILENKYAISPSLIKKDGIVWIPLYKNDIPNAIVLKTKPDNDDKLAITTTTSHIIKNRYTFISYNGLSSKLIKSLGKSPFDNGFIIIDEVHNFISRVVNGSVLARTVYSYLMAAKDAKIILLSGTPMINNPYEIATLINLIRGYMSVYQITYTKTSKILSNEEFNNQMNNKNLNNYIDEYTIDNENKKISISLLPHGFKRNSNDEIIKSDWSGSSDMMITDIINALNEMNGIKMNIKFNIYNYNALPNIKEEFNNFFLDTTDEDNPTVKNEDLFMRRILGAVSYYSISGSELFPKVEPPIKRELYMTDSQFKNYVEARNYEIKQDLNKKQGQGLFAESSSVYRAFTRAVCNFSFPEKIERIYPKDIKKHFRMIENMSSSNEDDDKKGGAPKKKKADVISPVLIEDKNDISPPKKKPSKLEKKPEKKPRVISPEIVEDKNDISPPKKKPSNHKKKPEKKPRVISPVIVEDKDDISPPKKKPSNPKKKPEKKPRVISPVIVEDKNDISPPKKKPSKPEKKPRVISPVIVEDKNDISPPKKKPSPEKKPRVISPVIVEDKDDISPPKKKPSPEKKPRVISPVIVEDKDDISPPKKKPSNPKKKKEDITPLKKKKEEKIIPVHNVVDEYNNQMKIMMDKLIKSDALDIDNLRKYYSPKFAQIITDVNESPGSVLIYSSFRTVEGLGILSEVFNRQGFKQISLKKIENEYYFTDIDIFNEKYDNKRYVIFDQDKDKTKLLMNLFNNDFKNITNEMRKALPKDPEQLYGKLVKIFCITQSGAEGISLKNVRRVLLVEPFWNNVRIEQVIGRAIRSCSHEALPKKDRNVQVFSYIMKLTTKQIQSDFNIERNDKGLSTDEHILETATKKKQIIDKFLNMMKSASFDCVINSKQNKPLQNTFKCYTWALGVNKNDFSYTTDINSDYKIMKHRNLQIAKKGKGKAIMKNGIKFIEMDGKYYDYYSYINAGVLVPELI